MKCNIFILGNQRVFWLRAHLSPNFQNVLENLVNFEKGYQFSTSHQDILHPETYTGLHMSRHRTWTTGRYPVFSPDTIVVISKQREILHWTKTKLHKSYVYLRDNLIFTTSCQSLDKNCSWKQEDCSEFKVMALNSKVQPINHKRLEYKMLEKCLMRNCTIIRSCQMVKISNHQRPYSWLSYFCSSQLTAF